MSGQSGACGASPFRLNLEQQRKRAKDLLDGLRAGDPESISRFRRNHPHGARIAGQAPAPAGRFARLSEAQLVIARELGLPSWPRLTAHIAAMARSRASMASDAPDRGMTTLHIRCGSDIGGTLAEAGFSGDFLEYSDPLCQGPVLDDDGRLDLRADFLFESFGAAIGRSRTQIAAKLVHAEEELQSASSRYERIVLWFEHDTYDQLILARCLAWFAVAPPQCLDLVSPAGFPGGVRFIGLGQLPPEALVMLWGERSPVSAASLQAGRDVWDMLRRPDPRPLAALARTGIVALPQLARALRRHCQELPWTTDGLSLTERLTLQLLAQGGRTLGQVFSGMMLEREPLPWMTDLIFLAIVGNMRRVSPPVLVGGEQDEAGDWTASRQTVTALGQDVLSGKVDFRSLSPPARWLGGVKLPGSGPCWRWDEDTASIVTA